MVVGVIVLTSPVVGALAPEADVVKETAQLECSPAAKMSEDDYCDPALVLPTDGATIEKIRSYAGQRFAGVWIDRSEENAPLLRVAFSPLQDADTTFLNSLRGADDQIRAQSAEYSWAEMQAVAEVAVRTLRGKVDSALAVADPRDGKVHVNLGVSR